MKQKTSERFTDVMIELAKINAKLDALIKVSCSPPVAENTEGYALKQGSLTDAGTTQEWNSHEHIREVKKDA